MPNAEARAIERLAQLIAKADDVLATHTPNPPGVIGFPTLAPEAFAEWQTQCITFMINLLGENHTYVERFKEDVESGHTGVVAAGKGILSGLKEDLELGLLARLRDLVTADVFTDFLEMAEHLLDRGYKDPAASLIGAVLEDGLRRITAKHNINIKRSDKLGALTQKLATAGVYNRLQQKKLHVWIDTRNNADHGHFNEYTADDVKAMHAGVQDFLGSHL